MKKDYVAVSIAMATFNGEKYLSEQLESILNQTLSPSEIIIVDDDSTDNTWGILLSYATKYPAIKLYRNEINLGVVKTFNRSILLCSGNYIALSDQDDYWLPNKLEILVDNIEDSLLIHSNLVVVDQDLIPIPNKFKARYRKKAKFINYLFGNNVTGCSAMFKRELITKALPIPEDFYIHDHYLAIIASYYGFVKYINQPLVKYRQHSENIIGTRRNSFTDFLKIRNKFSYSLNLLLNNKLFANNQLVTLARDYHDSIYLGSWKSKYSILQLLLLPKRVKYLISFYLLTGFGSKKLAKLFYQLFR